MSKLIIKNTEINLLQIEGIEFICITDMMKAKDGDFFVTDWLRNRNTLEYIGIWENLNNPNFNYGEFDLIKKKSGLNNFKISVKELSERTNLICLKAKSGRYGGTYAHKDIAFEFAMWISPEFKIYLISEFQKLKKEEQKLIGWTAKRELAKINYHIHTDAIKEYLIPKQLTKKETSIIYATEADVLNMALFCKTAKQWREENPKLQGNIRDYASINQLICLSNLENINALLIQENMLQKDRLPKLNELAIRQLTILENIHNRNLLK